MCGRYLFYDGKNEKIGNLIHIAQLNLTPGQFQKLSLEEVFPSQYALIGIQSEKGLHSLIMQWGYTGSHGLVINARSETAFSSSFFQPSVPCAVIACAYYEWDSHHQRFSFSAEQAPVFMGGLARREGSQWKYVILTEEAPMPQRAVHTRQPVLFTYEDARQWCTCTSPSDLLSHSLQTRTIRPQ